MISSNIRIYRERAGWTQKQLGRRTGIPAERISDFESAKRAPGFHQIKHIASAFGMTVHELVYSDAGGDVVKIVMTNERDHRMLASGMRSMVVDIAILYSDRDRPLERFEGVEVFQPNFHLREV